MEAPRSVVANLANAGCIFDSLPESIIERILYFLPNRDGARTSVLSRNWRYVFTSSLTKIDFDDCLNGMPLSRSNKINFKAFVDKLFFNPKHKRLECLRVNGLWMRDVQWDDDLLSLSGWICAAIWRDVNEIVVDLSNGALLILPPILFTCSSLVALKLYILGGQMKVPTKVYLPKLRTLNLSGMNFVDGCSILWLISGCPVLEDLDVLRCFIYGTSELNIHSRSLKRLVLDSVSFSSGRRIDFDFVIVIDAPSLVRFEYSGRVGKGYTFRNMESLEEARIEITHFDHVNGNRCATLLRGIRNLQTLLLTIHDNGVLSLPTHLNSVLEFQNLVELEFRNPGSDWKGTWIVEFLHFVPNLKKLTLDLADGYRGMKPLPEQVPPCLLYQIMHIRMLSFKAHTHKYNMVRYFLNHALVLEKLEIGGVLQQSTIEKLLRLSKSSKE